MKKPDVSVRLSLNCLPDVLKCDDCGRPAEVFTVYGECEVIQCASCYVKKNLPKMFIQFGGRADFDGAWVGTSYYMNGFELPEELQD